MRVRYDILPDVHKIAILRANALGDFIFTLPALDALRAAYPHAEVVLLAKNWHAQFLANRPGPVNRVIVIPPSRGVGEDASIEENAAEQEAFFKAMRQEHFDLAIQLHGGGRYSNPFLLRLGACRTLGLKTPDAVALDTVVPYIYFQSEILRYLEVVSLVGATATSIELEPRLTVTVDDLAEVEKIIPYEHGDQQKKPLIALHPGAGDPRRRWPAEKFAEVGDALAARGAHVVITGTLPEQSIAKAVENAMKYRAQNLCGCLSLGGLAGLLSRCAVVVSNDSGPLHVARAVGAATIGIYWCFNLYTAGPITRSRHRPFVSWRLECPICGRNCTFLHCEHRASFVADIPTEQVIAEALDLFSSESVFQKSAG